MKPLLLVLVAASIPLSACKFEDCDQCMSGPCPTASRGPVVPPFTSYQTSYQTDIRINVDAGLPSRGNDGGVKWDGGFAPDAGTVADGGRSETAGDGGLGHTSLDAGLFVDAAADVHCDAGGCGIPATPLCRFNNECGANGRCANGGCQRACSNDGVCGSGQTCQAGFCQDARLPGGQCVYGRDCAAGAACINGYCHAACAADGECARADRCVSGLCQPDLRPSPQCTSTATCPAGYDCVDAVCRTLCQTDAQCGPDCSGTVCSRGYCVRPQETSPQCSRDLDCGTARTCVDALCR